MLNNDNAASETIRIIKEENEAKLKEELQKFDDLNKLYKDS